MKTVLTRSLHFTLVLALSSATGCASVAIATAPKKAPVKDDSPAAAEADAAFWATLHGGRYDDIGPVLERLQQVYLERPNDPRTTAHIAFLHTWRMSERARMAEPRATITDDNILARRYFDEAVALAPDDARFRGFQASMTMVEGNIHHDEKLTRRGFFQMKDAVDAWPEFNLFTRGYSLSLVPETDPKFTDALDDQWRTLDLCAEAKVDRENLDFSPYMSKETRDGKKRVCWNSWIAPHNFEGFLLNMGDMIVKAGDPKSARRVYTQAKLAKEYPTWPFKDVLDRRIAQAEDNVAAFRQPAKGEPERRMMVESAFSCTGCHQEK